eukprot:CAMPEP_0185533606 /NCGR_PEP_ID=MMETSP1366-20130426/108531_1 /TAXON_ID=38817 /ORGANISM="Gephyrocapsa oceanica, Strain RCC1303" /LENGTH=566 /DNA_ID=CAMNT_0028145331 /DNA_START=27 /DNA_END=1723 /DNA_ORIENTATION=-
MTRKELLELMKSLYVRRPLLQAAFHFYGRAAAPASIPSRLEGYLVKTGNGHVHAPAYVVCVVADQAHAEREVEIVCPSATSPLPSWGGRTWRKIQFLSGREEEVPGGAELLSLVEAVEAGELMPRLTRHAAEGMRDQLRAFESHPEVQRYIASLAGQKKAARGLGGAALEKPPTPQKRSAGAGAAADDASLPPRGREERWGDVSADQRVAPRGSGEGCRLPPPCRQQSAVAPRPLAAPQPLLLAEPDPVFGYDHGPGYSTTGGGRGVWLGGDSSSAQGGGGAASAAAASHPAQRTVALSPLDALKAAEAGALLAYLQSYGAVEAVAAPQHRSWTPRDPVAGNFELVRFAEADAAERFRQAHVKRRRCAQFNVRAHGISNAQWTCSGYQDLHWVGVAEVAVRAEAAAGGEGTEYRRRPAGAPHASQHAHHNSLRGDEEERERDRDLRDRERDRDLRDRERDRDLRDRERDRDFRDRDLRDRERSLDGGRRGWPREDEWRREPQQQQRRSAEGPERECGRGWARDGGREVERERALGGRREERRDERREERRGGDERRGGGGGGGGGG